jgi:diguanylate cyclase (GGDEF)-like protein/PAS domain S-box-containing protein
MISIENISSGPSLTGGCKYDIKKCKKRESGTDTWPRRRRKAEKLLKDSEDLYNLLANHMKDLVWLLDLNLNIKYISPSVEKLTGYNLNEIKNITLEKLLTKTSFDKAMRFFSAEMTKALAAPDDYILKRSLELELRCRDGRMIWTENAFSFIRDENRKPVSLLCEGRDITDRRRAEKALRESEARHRRSEERYRNILDNMEEAYYEVDLKGDLTFFNATAVTNLGYSNEEMMGMNFREYVDKENERKVFEAFHRVFVTGESSKGVDWELISKSGEKKPIESSISLMRDTNGNPVGFRGIIRDITERKRAEEELRESERKFRSLTETAQDIILTVNMDGIITYANPAASAMAGRNDLAGMVLRDLISPDVVDQHLEMLDKHRRGFTGTMSYESKIPARDHAGLIYFDVKSTTLFYHGKPSGVLIIARDSTERKRTEEQIRLMAIVDTLTGLFNRRGFITLAQQQLKTAFRTEKKLLLFFIDLDGLKLINDTYGHEEGDRALQKTSTILKQTFRESDVIGRLGGDEFAVLVVDDEELQKNIFKRLKERIREENAAADISYPISMSIGVAEYDPCKPCSIEDLMFEADRLMYIQKKEKKQAGECLV